MDAYVGRPTSAGRAHTHASASTDDGASSAECEGADHNGVHPAWWHDVERQAAASAHQSTSTAGGAANKTQPRLAYSKHAPVADPTKNGASL
jgi:hypothetical protein